jgi:curved DNA-binding protein CbpA
MIIKNYYKILKVDQNSDLETIKKAFRREVAIYHPENNKSPEAKSKFEDVIEAYDVLSRPEKRSKYNEMLNSQTQTELVVLEQKQEEEYRDWNKEAKRKSKKYWDSPLTELLALDLLIDLTIVDSILDSSDGLIDGIGDAIGDIFDIF